jgi:thiosulfate/3-mercaptopyruvate sulfurtransferase
MLDGGIEKWEADGHPLETGTIAPEPADFEPGETRQPSVSGIDAADIRARLADPALHLVDVRAPAEFRGEQRRAARGGHIPGATLWPWDQTLREDGTLRDASEIRAAAEAAGLFADQELVTYCQGGVRAAHAALALRVAGYPRVRIYDGSWAEWGNDPTLPVEGEVSLAAS